MNRNVVFGLFRFLGHRFSPRLADIGETHFWGIDPHAIPQHRLSMRRILLHSRRIDEPSSAKVYHQPAPTALPLRRAWACGARSGRAGQTSVPKPIQQYTRPRHGSTIYAPAARRRKVPPVGMPRGMISL
ncbi:MAG: Tn3 family transposase [Acidobacteria bacterium]|nr:Tn3 family transposase [Acidobacteriota bacterium]